MSWKRISSKEVYRNRWMRVTEDEVETDTGRRLTYGVVRKEPFALIIPWDGRCFTLVGQYRYIVDAFTWEFPQGHFEHESIEQSAKTELREETGLMAKSIKKIGAFWIGPGTITQECNVFLATDLSKGEPEREESEEGMQTRKVTPREIKELIKDGTIKDGATITALTILEQSSLLA